MVEPVEQSKDTVDRLIGELKELRAPELQDALQAFLKDPEIGLALRRLADQECSTDESSGRRESKHIVSSKLSESADLQEAKSEYESKLHLAMKEQVFGPCDPSIAGFRLYLKELTKQTDFSYDDKKHICRTVNYWKERLSVELLFTGRACTLAAKSSGSRLGGFKLRSANAQRESLYARSTFPELTVQVSVTDASMQRTSPRSSGSLELEEARAIYERKLAEDMKESVFGTQPPTLAGFQAYLDRLNASSQPTTYKEKQEICKTIKYWRQSSAFRIDLLYGEKACRVSAKSNGGRGLYRIHVHGSTDPILTPDFPRLSCRKSL